MYITMHSVIFKIMDSMIVILVALKELSKVVTHASLILWRLSAAVLSLDHSLSR